VEGARCYLFHLYELPSVLRLYLRNYIQIVQYTNYLTRMSNKSDLDFTAESKARLQKEGCWILVISLTFVCHVR
jgi:hypothetical protein